MIDKEGERRTRMTVNALTLTTKAARHGHGACHDWISNQPQWMLFWSRGGRGEGILSPVAGASLIDAILMLAGAAEEK